MSAATVERVALALADEFGFEWVFESDATEEHFDAAYWRHVAQRALTAACETCEGACEVAVPVGPLDEFGNQGTDYVPCPECGETP